MFRFLYSYSVTGISLNTLHGHVHWLSFLCGVVARWNTPRPPIGFAQLETCLKCSIGYEPPEQAALSTDYEPPNAQ